MFEYNCSIERVVDGDTVIATIDLGFHIYVTKRIRLLGINAPELSTADGKNAKQYLITTLPATCRIKTELDRDDKYGRTLGTLFLGEVSVNDLMVSEGHAKVYPK